MRAKEFIHESVEDKDSSIDIKFSTSSQSNFEDGFTVTLLVNSEPAGSFKYYVDPYDGAQHSVEVVDSRRRSGYGTLLLLKTIETANEYMDGFQSDIRGTTKAQDQLYQKAEAQGLIQSLGLGAFDITASGERLLDTLNKEIVNEVPLPQDWDKDVYRGKGTFKDRIRYAVERAKKVGTGSSRVAFIIEYEGRPTVLKIAKNNKGLHQNNVEADILDDSYVESLGITIPLIDYDTENPQPLWIHTELAEKATQKKLCDIMKCPKMSGLSMGLHVLVDLAKVITGKYSKLPASQYLDDIQKRSGMSDEDLAILEDYATRIAELIVNFDLAPGDFTVPKNWGIYKGKPVIIDLGLSDTVLQSLYQKS